MLLEINGAAQQQTSEQVQLLDWQNDEV